MTTLTVRPQLPPGQKGSGRLSECRIEIDDVAGTLTWHSDQRGKVVTLALPGRGGDERPEVHAVGIVEFNPADEWVLRPTNTNRMRLVFLDKAGRVLARSRSYPVLRLRLNQVWNRGVLEPLHRFGLVEVHERYPGITKAIKAHPGVVPAWHLGRSRVAFPFAFALLGIVFGVALLVSG